MTPETGHTLITRADLPRSYRVHWSAARKAKVVQAVRKKVISYREARRRYLLSRSEFEAWDKEYGEKSASAPEPQPA